MPATRIAVSLSIHVHMHTYGKIEINRSNITVVLQQHSCLDEIMMVCNPRITIVPSQLKSYRRSTYNFVSNPQPVSLYSCFAVLITIAKIIVTQMVILLLSCCNDTHSHLSNSNWRNLLLIHCNEKSWEKTCT